MPVKWKIYRLAHYLQLVVSLVTLIFFSYGFLNLAENDEDFSYFLIFLAVMIIVIVNNSFNVYVLHWHYPDRGLSRGKKTFFILLLMLYMLVTIFLIVLTIAGIAEITHSDVAHSEDWTALGIIGSYVALCIYISTMQTILPRVLNRNNRRYMQQLVDDIGKPD